MRPLRYLVSSTAEFREVIDTVNQIVGRAESESDAEEYHRKCRFSMIRLPGSLSKFIACFDVPKALLGKSRVGIPKVPDFSTAKVETNRYRTSFSSSRLTVCYDVDTLFDLNVALVHLNAGLQQCLRGMEVIKMRRAMLLGPHRDSADRSASRVCLILPAVGVTLARRIQRGLSIASRLGARRTGG
jgi:hypothetical protein